MSKTVRLQQCVSLAHLMLVYSLLLQLGFLLCGGHFMAGQIKRLLKCLKISKTIMEKIRKFACSFIRVL